MIKRALIATLAVAGLTFATLPAQADNYPSRTVKIIVPYPPGGPTDQAARIVAQHLSKELHGNFIVENLSGGGTIIATNKVAKSVPDGYTLLFHNLQISANVTLYKHLPFNTVKALTPVIFVNRDPLVLVGRESLKPNDFKQLISLMKKKTLNFAIPGYGSTGHLAAVLFAELAKVKTKIIPYRGAAPEINDILGNHVDVTFLTPQSVVQDVKSNKMKAYGVTSKETLPQLPQAKSLVSVFGPKMTFMYWQALFAPAGTPKAIIQKLNAAVRTAVSDPAVLKLWSKQGEEPFPKSERSVAAAKRIFRQQIARWGKVIRDNNIHVSQ